jgi:hypothetical protein
MKPIITSSFVAIIVLTSLSFSFHTDNVKMKEVSEKGFAVVELFTSEGCSSCPPADEAMARLAKEFPDNVYFLGYHVDYWNYIGWKDEFSKPGFTERQRKYSDVFGLNSIYTPQAVVNGKKEFVGSKENLLRSVIQNELKDSAGSAIVIETKKTGEKNISVSCRINTDGKSLLNIALVQLQAVTHVKRGENSGRKLGHINIVRELKTVAVNNGTTITLDLPVPPGLTTKDVKLVAFMQDKQSMRITGAAETIIP